MSKKKDILDGTKVSNLTKKFGLIYTCNCGWIDLGHLNPENKREEIGASNLWKQINTGSKTIGKGFLVRYRQDHAAYPLKPGREGVYIVKHGLSMEQKKSVALAIFMEVSERFENFQKILGWVKITDSGYSQEDLVSNLIGFYIAINEVSRLNILKKCHPVSDKAALLIWGKDGAVGKNKNTSWNPRYANGVPECANQPKNFPKELQRIKPATKGKWHFEMPFSSGGRDIITF